VALTAALNTVLCASGGGGGAAEEEGMGEKLSLTGVLNDRVLAAWRERAAARLEKSDRAMLTSMY